MPARALAGACARCSTKASIKPSGDHGPSRRTTSGRWVNTFAEAPMPQRAAKRIRVASLAGPGSPTRTCSGTSSGPSKAASHARIGCGVKANCVTSVSSEWVCRAYSILWLSAARSASALAWAWRSGWAAQLRRAMPWAVSRPESNTAKVSWNGPAGRARSPAINNSLYTPASVSCAKRSSKSRMLSMPRAVRCGTGVRRIAAKCRQAATLSRQAALGGCGT